ncbi:MAG: HAD-IA family hydrolase [Hyphomonadaceae bacterium]|nr:HAD-IA family hydrolase [Hyphomonadaceae bacterium]
MKLAIFDIDGTLVDSRRIIHDAMLHAYDRSGLPDPGYDRIRRVIGLGLRQAFATLEPDAPDDILAELEKAYVEAFIILRETEHGREPLYAGALDLLEQLHGEGWKLGVATGKSRRGVGNILRMHELERLFHASVCAEDGPGKPDPFMVLENLRLTGVCPTRTVVIGDATHDMIMARAANVRALGVCWGFAEPVELQEAGAHELHHDYASLTQSLAALGREIR